MLLDRDGERAESEAAALAATHASDVIGMGVDVADARRRRDAAASAVAERFGRADLVVSNVGVQLFGVDRAAYRRRVAVGARRQRRRLGTRRHARSCRCCGRSAHGRLAFTTSSSVLAPGSRLAAYQASKFAVWGLAETLRLELADDGIGVSVIFPSGMISRHLETSEAAQPEHLRRAVAADDDLAAMFASNPAMAADLATPEDAVAQVFDALLADEPFIVTHGDLVDRGRRLARCSCRRAADAARRVSPHVSGG